MSTVIDQLKQFIEEVKEEIGVEVTRQLIDRTPVDTGWAQSNWIGTLDRPFQTTAGTRKEAEAGRLDTRTAFEGIQSFRRNRIGQRIWITNNVPYIVLLNQGSSRQAPPMFVETAIANGIRRALANVSRRRT